MTKEHSINLVFEIKKATFIALALWLLTASFARSAEINGLAPATEASSHPAAEQASDLNKVAPSAEPQDFLLETSPLSKPSSQTVQPENEKISMIEAEGIQPECTATGNATQGTKTCIQRNADGSFSESASVHEKLGDEKKEQTVIRYYHSNGESAGQDTTRIKTSYYAGSPIAQRESYDIVTQPARGLINRDWVVKDYDRYGKTKKTVWAHYIETGEKTAGLVHHAVLYYQDGKLNSGFANRYKDGKVVDALLNYNPEKNPNLRLEKTGVLKWTRWIDQLISQTKPSAL